MYDRCMCDISHAALNYLNTCHWANDDYETLGALLSFYGRMIDWCS